MCSRGNGPDCEAVLVAGDKVIAVGSNAKIKALAGPEAVKVDLGGRTVIPGW
jgi:predicted amidohydrolase YtcJ